MPETSEAVLTQFTSDLKREKRRVGVLDRSMMDGSATATTRTPEIGRLSPS